MFETARLLGLKKEVWTSSSAVFATGTYEEEYIPNDAPHYPWGLYGATKSFGEGAAEYYFRAFGVDITGIRQGGMIFGAGQHQSDSGVLIRGLFLNPALGKPGRVPWGDDTIGWSYADDVARVHILALKHRRVKTGAFNITGHMHSMREVADWRVTSRVWGILAHLPSADGVRLPFRPETAWEPSLRE